MNPKKLMIRTISGLVYVALIIGCVCWGMTPFNWMAAAFAALAVHEFEKITHELNQQTFPVMLLDIFGAVCLVFAWKLYPLAAWVAIIIFRLVIQLYLRSETPLEDLSRSFMSQLYIGLPLGIMVLLADVWHLHAILAIFFLIWLNDTGAFIVGSSIGKHRLFERISPKKSWEGFFGGLIFDIAAATLFGIYLSAFFGLQIGLPAWIGLGVVVCVFSTWGDLVESLIKRSLHIKDSGNIIPGHGGILDRIDSSLLVMPASFLYLMLISL